MNNIQLSIFMNEKLLVSSGFFVFSYGFIREFDNFSIDA
ncbi:hypothetical protein HMPREF9412_5895 [Paenibacillus sp. HGF5]|nr:hypothetical protein HMPREF9412_5895 [Paenibacillus sp. HGF5]